MTTVAVSRRIDASLAGGTTACSYTGGSVALALVAATTGTFAVVSHQPRTAIRTRKARQPTGIEVVVALTTIRYPCIMTIRPVTVIRISAESCTIHCTVAYRSIPPANSRYDRIQRSQQRSSHISFNLSHFGQERTVGLIV